MKEKARKAHTCLQGAETRDDGLLDGWHRRDEDSLCPERTASTQAAHREEDELRVPLAKDQPEDSGRPSTRERSEHGDRVSYGILSR